MPRKSASTSKPTPIAIAQAFGLQGISPSLTMQGYAQPCPLTPKKDDLYQFDTDLLFDVIQFIRSPNVALRITGHSGTGKSSFVQQFYSRLNSPLFTFNAKPTTRAQELIGGFTPTETGGLKFVLGPLAQAAKEGLPVLIDEYNVIDPAEATGLNDVLEGRPIGIPETGETIVPAPGFKIFVTQNPRGPGYRGRNLQDAANDERFLETSATYMPPASEIPLIQNVLISSGFQDGQTALAIAEKMVNTANSIRKAYMGTSNDAAALEVTMSTRTIVRWAQWFMLCTTVNKRGYSAEHYALERVLTKRASPETRQAIHEYVKQEFGTDYLTPDTRAQLAA